MLYIEHFMTHKPIGPITGHSGFNGNTKLVVWIIDVTFKGNVNCPSSTHPARCTLVISIAPVKTLFSVYSTNGCYSNFNTFLFWPILKYIIVNDESLYFENVLTLLRSNAYFMKDFDIQGQFSSVT